MRKRLESYIHSHRKETYLSQREVARLLGYGNDGPVSRQERLESMPPLLIAIGYSVLFGKPLTELFAGLFEVVEVSIEERLAALKHQLLGSRQSSSKKGMATRKIAWVSARHQELSNRKR